MNKMADVKKRLSKRKQYKKQTEKIQDVIDKYTKTLYDISHELAQYWKEFTIDFHFWEIKFMFTHKPVEDED